MIRFKCYFCGQELESPDSSAGGEEVCQECHTANFVPRVVSTVHLSESQSVDLGPRIIPMSCPHCGKPASEYAPDKWQCLTCRRKFLYEPPKKPDKYVRIEEVSSLDGSSFFVCGNCGGRFPRGSIPEFTCRRCHKSFCPEHKWKIQPGVCDLCFLRSAWPVIVVLFILLLLVLRWGTVGFP
jgi:hypothetical protein